MFLTEIIRCPNGILIFQIWAKYDKWKNPENYEFDWKAVLEEE